jgi:hypothetical protein
MLRPSSMTLLSHTRSGSGGAELSYSKQLT